MPQDFLNLEEAAQKLGIRPEELAEMAQRREIRAFADRGTWQFRAADIEEQARQRGLPSGEVDLPDLLNDDVFAFSGPRSDVGKPAGDIHDTGKVSMGGSDVFTVTKGSDLELQAGDDDEGPASSSFVFGSAARPSSTPKTPFPPVELAPESALITPAQDDDSVVPIGREGPGPGPGDSQVRLDTLSGRLPDSGVRFVDFDLPSMSGLMPPPSSRKMQPIVPPSSGKMKPATPPPSSDLPTQQFDLDEDLILTPDIAEDESDFVPLTVQDLDEDSVDLGATTGVNQKQDLLFGDEESDEGAIDLADDGAPLELEPTGSASRVNLVTSSEFDLNLSPPANIPNDSVFDIATPSSESLELQMTDDLTGSEDSLEFVIDEKPSTGTTWRGQMPPADQPEEVPAESATFELSLEGSSEIDIADLGPAAKPLKAQAEPPLSSEFDLGLDQSEESSSDFELTLESDTSLPVMGDQSGSVESAEPSALSDSDADMTSDFELALDDDSSSVVDETGSEVVVIEDDEEVEPVGAAALAGPALAGEVIEEDEVAVLEEEEELVKVAGAAAAPAEWKWYDTLPLMFSTPIMLFAGFLMYEMVRSVWSYNQPNIVTGPVFELVKGFTR